MAERTSYAPGTPSWVDLGTPDTEAAAAFYGGLFGWTIHLDERPEAGGYGLATLRGLNVAGVMAQMNPGPPYWAVYVAVTDADETAAKITDNGGTVAMGPMDVMDAGRMAVAQDPLGTFFGIWQARAHTGAQVVNEPGSFTWNELATADVGRSRDFYGAVFGWGTAEDEGHDPTAAAIFTAAGNVVCGAHKAGEGEFPAWSVWFAVDDCDASAARATELGGSVVMPPSDMDFGRGAVVADPQGAVFGIGAVTPEAMAESGG
jgi:predicted enzyme related to lactoylglutathione lyase